MSRGVARLLFIGPDHGTAVGGREQLSRLHLRALSDLLGDRLETILLPRRPLSGAAAVRAVVSGRIDGTDRVTEQSILAHIVDRAIDTVWLDGSNLGVLARAIKCRYPTVDVATFFHNVESRFFIGALRQRPGPRALGVVAATYFAERMAVRSSDRRVALNTRDSNLLHRLYGRAATDLLPMAIPCPAGSAGAESPAPVMGDYLLFVGSGFYANQAGILWFARHVAPHVSIPTLIVGRGLEMLGPALAASPNIELVGEVGDLGPYYRHATAVVAPIFDGSGMKTKVAEALMHGKRVVGTREAFVGYEEIGTGALCSTPEQFVSEINAMGAAPPLAFDPRLRELYEANYSSTALEVRLRKIVFAHSQRG